MGSDASMAGYQVSYRDLADIGGVAFPRTVDLRLGGIEVELHYKDVQLSPAIDPAMFTIQPPPAARRVPLGD